MKWIANIGYTTRSQIQRLGTGARLFARLITSIASWRRPRLIGEPFSIYHRDFWAVCGRGVELAGLLHLEKLWFCRIRRLVGGLKLAA